MKRRLPSPSSILVLGGAFAATLSTTAPSTSIVVEATLSDDYGLHVRRDIQYELEDLSHGEFAPLAPQPNDDEESFHRKLASCTSPLTEWTTQEIRDMGYLSYKELFENKIIQMAYVYKHYIDKTHEDEYFVNDVQTEELVRRHRDTIDFWNTADIDNSIMKDEILLLSMHGSDLKDNGKLIPTIMKIFDFTSTSDVIAFASKVQTMIEDLPGGYDNPLLTMNAVATRSTHNHGTFNGHSDSSRRVKDSIIIGDGVLKFLLDGGYETSGPDFVHAHEFGHHLQFQMDLAVPPDAGFVHDDRRKELMADALGGYFLAHDDGGDFDADEIGVFDRTAFATGDCSVANADHHGTPEQRQCAAIWGASLAAWDHGAHVPVLDPEVFVNSFNVAYSDILGLNWRECTLVLESTTSVDYDVPEEEEWDDDDDDYDDDYEEEEKPISIEDWLNSVEEENEKYESKWKDKVQTEEENRQPKLPSYNAQKGEGGGASSAMPIIEEELQWESEDEEDDDDYWLAKPDYDPATEIIGKGTPSNINNGGQIINPPPSWDGGMGGRGKPSEEHHESHTGAGATKKNIDRGSPSRTQLDNALTVQDCRMPGIHCYSSSSFVVSFSGMMYVGLMIVSLIM